MSKTITKKVSQRVNTEHLASAFRLMGIDVQQDAEIRLFANKNEVVSIALSPQELEKLGVKSAYQTGIGINISTEGQAEMRYDHANEAAAKTLAGLLPGLSQIGSAAGDIQKYLEMGFTLRPHIDLENQEYGVFLESKDQGQQHLGGAGW